MSTELSHSDEVLRQRFYLLQTRQDIAALLEVTDGSLTYHLFRSDPAERYRTFEIPKRRGGVRAISAPQTALKLIQRKLNQVLVAVYEPRRSIHGFVRDRNIITNATKHVGREWVFNIDLEDFFPTITFARVRAMFMSKPYGLPAAAATVLAQICCHDGRVPQGAPTSPIVSNMICAPLDAQLRRLAERHRAYYTRYADDITFSCHARRFPNSLAVPDGVKVVLGLELVAAIEKAGFRVNAAKVRLQHRLGRQEVTGLVVNRKVNVDRRLIRQVRAMLYAWKRHGYNAAEAEFRARWDRHARSYDSPEPTFRNVVRGKLEFIASVKGLADPTYVNLVRRARRLDASFQHTLVTYEDAVWIVHSMDERSQGTAFFMEDFGLITCAHVAVDELLAVRATATRSTRHSATIARVSRAHDLAILSTNAPRLHGFRHGDSSIIATGDELTILGYPQWSEDQSLQVTRTRVTGRRPVLGISRIAVATPIIPGNSGGPVLDRNGRVVGVAARGSWDFNPNNESAVIPIEAFISFASMPPGRDEDEGLFAADTTEAGYRQER